MDLYIQIKFHISGFCNKLYKWIIIAQVYFLNVYVTWFKGIWMVDFMNRACGNLGSCHSLHLPKNEVCLILSWHCCYVWFLGKCKKIKFIFNFFEFLICFLIIRDDGQGELVRLESHPNWAKASFISISETWKVHCYFVQKLVAAYTVWFLLGLASM